MSKNLLILLSDEHNKRMLGVSGHSHVKTPNLDKLAENGAVIVKEEKDAGVALNFQILAQRTSGFCYGSMDISLNLGADVLGLRVIGSIYRYQAIDIEPQNFNITALDWLSEKLQELD